MNLSNEDKPRLLTSFFETWIIEQTVARDIICCLYGTLITCRLCSQVSQRQRTRHTQQAAAILGTLVSDYPIRQVTTLALITLITLTTIIRPISRPWTWTWITYRRRLPPITIPPPRPHSSTIPIWTSTTPCLCELTYSYSAHALTQRYLLTVLTHPQREFKYTRDAKATSDRYKQFYRKMSRVKTDNQQKKKERKNRSKMKWTHPLHSSWLRQLAIIETIVVVATSFQSCIYTYAINPTFWIWTRIYLTFAGHLHCVIFRMSLLRSIRLYTI